MEDKFSASFDLLVLIKSGARERKPSLAIGIKTRRREGCSNIPAGGNHLFVNILHPFS
jgi:hypothetical protein